MSALRTIRRAGSRYYLDPETHERVPGVTSIIDMLPKSALTFWYAKMAAESAVDNVGAVVQLLVNGQRAAAIDMIKGAARRYTTEAASVGTEVHDLFERMARGEQVPRLHPDVQPYADHIQDFLDRCQPRFLHIEDTVWSDSHLYAGSFDWIAEIGGDVVMGDTKTTRSGVKSSVALQLAAYRHADRIVTRTGEHIGVPVTSHAAVFHVRPEGWQLVPVNADGEVFDYFLHLRRIFAWEKEASVTAVGHPLIDTRTESTGSQRRAS
ncbi:hypothetical protein JOD54_001092 [Actinokineospora baliensis]|uniref:hypothetical protein n=1 Tax=Actinokineospora baliensis TaxID=547056 RepID=UPI001958BC5A|nr:hypothetical protein [Actinokineospora baliensis]MBM7770888.1 hypothetical protein [Actinokineospora baliensis]